jgi:hypothetical protein
MALIAIVFLGFKMPPLHTSDGEGKKYKLLLKIPLNGSQYTTDNLFNIYLYRGSALKKFNSSGTLLFSYDDKSYGDITSLDMNDPMKLLVFYRDFPEIIYLDNTLSINGAKISPSDAGFPLSTLACSSHDDGIWLYDSQNLQLVRFDVNMNITVKTGNLVPVIGFAINPLEMEEYNSFLYMNDSTKGIMVFDQFGSYSRTIPITGLASYEVRGDDMYYLKDNKIHVFHIKTDNEDVAGLPEKQAVKLRVEKNMLFESSGDTLRLYTIN